MPYYLLTECYSKSAFTRQINIWKAFKNIKNAEAQGLIAQRKIGQRPQVDSHGRPIPWNRVFRATRSQSAAQRLRQQNHQQALISATRLQKPPIDYDSRVVHLVSNIWRASTKRFADHNPSTLEYQALYDKYHSLIRSLDIISMSFESWPKEANILCGEMYTLIEEQPAMACEAFIFLIKRDPAEGHESVRSLKNSLFKYIRDLSKERLPANHSLRRLLWSLESREAYTRLGGAIAKAKLDAMWKTSTKEIGQKHHQRIFFRQVLMKAILVISEYGESHYAASFLPELSKPYEPVPIGPQIYDTLDEIPTSSRSPVTEFVVP